MKKLGLAFLLGLGVVLSAAAEKIENFSHYYRQDCSFVAGEAADANDWCNRGNAAGKAPNVVVMATLMAIPARPFLKNMPPAPWASI
jgi:hypothetical protein